MILYNTPGWAQDDYLDHYLADVENFSDYYPYGMQLTGMHGTENSDGYRYQFNGMETDNEVKGSGNSYDFGNRMYDSRLGRFLSTDAYKSKYTDISPYASLLNNPLIFKDPSGDTVIITVSGTPVGTTMINLYSGPEIKNNPKLRGKQVEVPVYEVTITNESGSSATYYFTRISYRGNSNDISAEPKDVTYNVLETTEVQGVVKSRWGGTNNVLEFRDFDNKSNQAVKGTRGMGSEEIVDRVAIQFHVKGASDGCLLCVGTDQFVSKSFELFEESGSEKPLQMVGTNSSKAQSNFMSDVMNFRTEDVNNQKSDFIKIIVEPIEK